jgi:tricorn protease
MTRSSFLYTAIFYLQVLWGNPLPAVDETKPLLLQRPAINKTHVAFGYAGDLWLVEREGGEARRLTSGVGLEYSPLFSPDGSKLAFTAEYDGNFDVYIAPGKGGEPRRLTFHPGVDVAVGWTPDGQSVLFSSNRTSYSRFNKLFTFRIEGEGFPQELPLPMGEEGSFSAGGSHLAYVPFWNRRSSAGAYIAWKRYRGGKASPIWIADLSDSRVEKIPRDDSNDFCPMWLSGKIYFLSDRDGPTTLYSYDVSSKQVKRELENGGYDLNYASAGPDAIVFEQFGALHIFDPASGRSKKLDVRITADFPAVRPRYEKVAKKISGSSISPTGARAAFEVRGEIVTVPAEKGDIRNLTQTTAVVERDPAWSPDGKTVAYFSDESGEYMLHLRDARGTAEPRRIALGDAPNFYFTPVWSPDSQKIAYADNRQQLWFVEVTTGQSQKVDRHAYFSGSEFDPAWSPDSRWLAYTKILDNRLQAAWLLDTTTGERHQVTDGMSDVRFLAFDKSGKYLYFTASTDIGPTTNGIDMSGMQRDVTRSVYLVVLSKELPSPLAPESDEEKVKDPAKDQPGEPDRPARDKPAAGGGIAPADSDDAKSSDAKPSSDKTPSEKEKAREEKPAVTRIDLNGIGQRVLALPIPARDYEGLQVGKAGTIFLVEMPAGPIAPRSSTGSPETGSCPSGSCPGCPVTRARRPSGWGTRRAVSFSSTSTGRWPTRSTAPGAWVSLRTRTPGESAGPWSSTSSQCGRSPTRGSGRCAARVGPSRTPGSWRGWPWIAP